LEAATLEEMTQAASDLIPELLILNGVLKQGDNNQCLFESYPN
jgi:hypothetical protein